MNLKKIILSLATSGLLLGSAIPASSQTSDDESYTYLIPILDLILNSDTECTEPSALSIVNATANGNQGDNVAARAHDDNCLLYTSPSPRDLSTSRMPSSA